MKNFALTLAIAFAFSMIAVPAMACSGNDEASVTSSDKPIVDDADTSTSFPEE